MKERSLAVGSTLAALLASACCLGPLLLGGVGLGTAVVVTFALLRPYFLALSAVLLAAGFYFVYRRPPASKACEGEVCAPQGRPRRMAKRLLGLATVAVAALAFFPSYGSKLVGTSRSAAPSAGATIETAQLKITGMDCEVCAGVIQRKLLESRGVVRAEVRYPAGSATVEFDPSQMNTEKLIAVVNSTGYKASLTNGGQK